MPMALLFAGLAALIWGGWIVGERWRKYHEKHIAPLESEKKSAEDLRSSMERTQKQLVEDVELFTRNLRAEIRQHQKAKNEAYEELNPLRDRKSQLHNDMDCVRSKLNSWHRNSKSFFGNKRQKIKNDSILGWFGLEQTMAQKESLENRRNSISSEICVLKNEISNIYEQQIKPAKDGIKAISDDSERLKRHLQGGKNEQFFRSKIRMLVAKISKIDVEILRLKKSIKDITAAYKS